MSLLLGYCNGFLVYLSCHCLFPWVFWVSLSILSSFSVPVYSDHSIRAILLDINLDPVTLLSAHFNCSQLIQNKYQSPHDGLWGSMWFDLCHLSDFSSSHCYSAIFEWQICPPRPYLPSCWSLVTTGMFQPKGFSLALPACWMLFPPKSMWQTPLCPSSHTFTSYCLIGSHVDHHI